jgi:hypothetical protein
LRLYESVGFRHHPARGPARTTRARRSHGLGTAAALTHWKDETHGLHGGGSGAVRPGQQDLIAPQS